MGILKRLAEPRLLSPPCRHPMTPGNSYLVLGIDGNPPKLLSVITPHEAHADLKYS